MSHNAPLVIIFYNRLATVEKLLNVVRRMKPQKIYFIADGPRNQNDMKKTSAVRNFIDDFIDWNAKITKIYANENMGLRRRIETGLNEVFRKEDKAIILEDDCIPSASFFPFCEELLDKYKNNTEIFSISGVNLFSNSSKQYSYRFSRYFHSWGWATWKRAWNLYGDTMSDIFSEKENILFEEKFSGPREVFYWKTIFDAVKAGNINSWAYRWLFVHFKNRAYSIIPNCNLIKNIGFGKIATNTRFKPRNLAKKTEIIRFPLKHPTSIVMNEQADNFIGSHMFATPKNIIAAIYKKYW